MLRILTTVAICLSSWLVTLVLPVHAATVIKLNLGADASDDIQLSGGTFSTIDDGDIHTAGSQNTTVEFSDFLSSFPNIASTHASFSLLGLTPTGDSTTFSGWLVEQDFVEGQMALYAPDNTLLLSADLNISAVTGPLGAPGLQGLFLAVGDVTDGILKPFLDPDSLSIRMKLPSINNGGGFSVSPSPGSPAPDQYFAPLNAFAAGATVEIRAEQVPEPATLAMLCVAALAAGYTGRRPASRL
jgi:hypothetical protein